MLQLRRIGRAHAQGPFAAQRRQVLAGQLQPLHLDLDPALAIAAEGTHRDAQDAALAGGQIERLLRLVGFDQAQLALGVQLHL
ncbi:hypothetical protein D3C85_504790 [compost metagenome]